jgi:hypothetical protein
LANRIAIQRASMLNLKLDSCRGVDILPLVVRQEIAQELAQRANMLQEQLVVPRIYVGVEFCLTKPDSSRFPVKMIFTSLLVVAVV